MSAIGRMERGQTRMAAGIQELVTGQKEQTVILRALHEGQVKLLESQARLSDSHAQLQEMMAVQTRILTSLTFRQCVFGSSLIADV